MQQHLLNGLHKQGEQTLQWTDCLPRNCPPHRTSGVCSARREEDCRPYAFKGFALREAQGLGYTSLLWCDACIVPVAPLAPIWEKIERDGYWICKNGYNNYEWTASSAYEDLFPEYWQHRVGSEDPRELAILENRRVEHVVATCFGISTAHPIGDAFLAEYYRLASETRAFCGPWQNSNAPKIPGRNNQRPAGPCGPPDVLGHRHDQSCASVIAWRLGMHLSDPVWFSYDHKPDTILWARGEI